MHSDSGIRELGRKIENEMPLIEEFFTAFGSRIIGQRDMVERLLTGLVSGGHILLEGVPGLAKTLAMRTLADLVDADFGDG